MFSVAPNILLAPNMTQNAERKHRTQDANTAHNRLRGKGHEQHLYFANSFKIPMEFQKKFHQTTYKGEFCEFLQHFDKVLYIPKSRISQHDGRSSSFSEPPCTEPSTLG